MEFLIKILVTALLVAGISELGKRSSHLAAILASLPLTSILAMLWLYRDTGSTEKISELSYGIFWAVLPSLAFFLVLPLLLKTGLRFSLAMLSACALMFGAYSIYALALRSLGVKL
jgi:uncharacterized membrane protein (GlpM family)